MTRPDLIAIGPYESWDDAAMDEAYAVHRLHAADEVATLPDDVRARARAVAFKGHDALTASHMDALPALGLIANYGVGYDAIDVGAAAARGVRVTNTPGVLSDCVADLAVAMVLAQARKLVEASDWVRSGRWAREGSFPLQRQVTGRRVGILGLGRIGREIADRMAAFKTEIHYHARAPKQTPRWTFHADPVALARAVDILIVALVGGPETQGYVSREVIAALGPDGVLVNIARGSVVDETALIDALEAGTIRGAALDVFTGEPDIDPRFLALDNVLLQPHQASATVETRQAMGRLQRANIAAFFAGEPLPSPVG